MVHLIMGHGVSGCFGTNLAPCDIPSDLGLGRPQRRRDRPLRSTTAELIRVKRYKFPDAHRQPASHPLHAVRPARFNSAIVIRCRVRSSGNPCPFQLPFPIRGGYVRVVDLTVERVQVLSHRFLLNHLQ